MLGHHDANRIAQGQRCASIDASEASFSEDFRGCARQSREKAKSSMEKPSRLHHKVASGTGARQPLHGLHNHSQERRTRQE